jgi:hypothetical protein
MGNDAEDARVELEIPRTAVGSAFGSMGNGLDSAIRILCFGPINL